MVSDGVRTMKTTGNTILITGGGSGIGRGFAEAFHKLGNQVIISGRRQKVLDEVVAANPGMRAFAVDMTDAGGLREFAAQVAGEFPTLNVLVNNAGVAKMENLLDQPADLADVEQMVATNVLGPIRLTAALLPHLLQQKHASVLNVSSGLAMVPLAGGPTYSATKAALHSYTESLRYQLRDSAIEVIEVIPPYVQTHLGGERQANDPRAMPLDAFIKECMDILQNQPDATEVNVKNVYPLRYAASEGPEKYEQFFQQLNQMMAGQEH